jgi:hypothetical protein
MIEEGATFDLSLRRFKRLLRFNNELKTEDEFDYD